MPLFDQHLHSRHSCDSQADPAENVRQAIERGLAGLTFTEHFDVHPDDWATCVYDDTAYSNTISSLRDSFGHRIFIGKGIEVCFQPERMDFILDFLDRHEFDLIVLSIHYFDGKPLHRQRSWDGLDAQAGTELYLRGALEAASWCERTTKTQGRRFDVLGHLDLAKRYTRRFFDTYDMNPHRGLIDEILQTCLAAELTPEINTSSLRQGLRETMPGPPTIQRYAQLGGTAMSVGSDAHRSQDVGAGFDEAAGLLRSAGLSSVVFKQRVRTLVEVDFVQGR